MAVAFEELAGSPRYSGSKDKLSATRRGLIDWAQKDNIYLELFPPAVGDKPSLPVLLQDSSTLYAANVTIEPWLGENDVPDCAGSSATYDKALVEITYETIPYEQGGGASDQIITRKWTTSGNFITLPSHGLKWKASGRVVADPDVNAGFVVPMADLAVTLHRVTPAYFSSLRANVHAMQGKINSGAFEGCPAGTLLLLGGDFTQTVSSDGSKTWQCEVRFQYRVVHEAGGTARGWNWFYNPDAGEWQELCKRKNGDPPIFEDANFTTLYT